MRVNLYTLVETELFAWQLSRLGPVQDMDQIVGDLLWAIARLADDLPRVQGSKELRFIESKPLLDDDGAIVRLMIRFLIRNTQTAELLTVEAYPDQN